jgi:protein-disulfide isomerase
VGVVGVAAVVGFLFVNDLTSFSAKTKKSDGASASVPMSGTGTIGTVFGTPVSRESLTSGEKSKLFETEQQAYQAYEELLGRRYVEEFFKRYMKEQNLPTVDAAREAYLKANVRVPDEQVKAVVEQYKTHEKLKNLSPEMQLKEVRTALEMQARQGAMGQLMAQGRQKNEFAVSVARPVEPRLDISDAGNPFMGAKDAKVTIIEFADYQCPFCARVVPTLVELVKKYDGKVRWVYRDFPLDFHPNAKPAAVVANCAGAQGKYFEAHHFLYENTNALSEDVYSRLVDSLKLDKAKFDACRKDPEQMKEVETDFAAGAEFGVNGTPAYFINGRKFSGGMGKADFERVIEEELARK